MTQFTTDVLIVGAGPAGLTIANVLLASGVNVRILDKKAGPTRQSRALVVHAKTLELLDKLDVAEQMVEKAQRMDALRILSNGKLGSQVSFQGEHDRTPYPFSLIYPQDQTEQLLLEHLEQRGGYVEWNTEFLHMEQTETSIHSTVQHADGNREMIEVGWLIGADGSHSPIRHALSLRFTGESYKQALFLADVDLEGEIDDREIAGGLTHQGFITFLPMPGEHQFRLIGTLPLEPANRETLTIDEIQLLVNDAYREGAITITALRWISIYHTHHRISERFRVGRAFLIGDAAHIHSPATSSGAVSADGSWSSPGFQWTRGARFGSPTPSHS